MSPSGVEINRTIPFGAQVRRLDEARAATQAGLLFDPTFTIRRLRAGTSSDNAIYLARRENLIEGMRKAGLPEE